MDIVKKDHSKWTPKLWETAHTQYPATTLSATTAQPYSHEFRSIWQDWEVHNSGLALLEPIKSQLHIFLVRGIFGKVLPGNFIAVRDQLKMEGYKVTISPIYLTGKVEECGALLYKQVQKLAAPTDQLIFLSQSKGGLDTFEALYSNADLRERTRGMVVVQTPSGPAAVMESILLQKYAQTASRFTQFKEWWMKRFLSLPFILPGCLELIEPHIRSHAERFQSFSFPFPIISLASWSETPSSWLDSYHKRLHEIRPGAAHDGQFYLEDQLWSHADQIILGHIDHSQSVMKGLGVDTARLWGSLLSMLSRRL